LNSWDTEPDTGNGMQKELIYFWPEIDCLKASILFSLWRYQI
jgi:hypothetical protein